MIARPRRVASALDTRGATPSCPSRPIGWAPAKVQAPTVVTGSRLGVGEEPYQRLPRASVAGPMRQEANARLGVGASEAQIERERASRMLVPVAEVQASAPAVTGPGGVAWVVASFFAARWLLG